MSEGRQSGKKILKNVSPSAVSINKGEKVTDTKFCAALPTTSGY